MNIQSTIRSRFWDSYSIKYDKFIEKYAYKSYSKLMELIYKELESTDEVLEIGVGTEVVTFAIAENIKK